MAANTSGAAWLRQDRRRGVLLLIVLSMLSLFMMLGVAYVMIASRARDASRGFSRGLQGTAGAELPAAEMLDRAALLLIRGHAAGATAPARVGGSATFRFEALLEDLYGSAGTLTGEVASSQDFAPLCSVSVNALAGTSLPASPVELTGRIVTFLPSNGKASSHRILRATDGGGGTYTLWIANVGSTFAKNTGKTGAPTYSLPPARTKVIINGRERSGAAGSSNEPWDGYDFNANPFLAQVEPIPATPSQATVLRASMIDADGAAIASAGTGGDVDADGIPDQCDNDNDGFVDGQFFDPGFPALVAPNGNTIVTHMSCLVVDLDGRLNANAHGTIAHELYPPSHSGWPATPPNAWRAFPLGSGYGPAEISGAGALQTFNAARSTPQSDLPWMSLSLGAQPAVQYSALAVSAQNDVPGTPAPGCRVLPMRLPAMEGRYAGEARSAPLAANATMPTLTALPGVNLVNDALSKENEQVYAGVKAPIDLHGRMKSRAVAPVAPAVIPTLAFAKPDDSDEFVDDPYEIVLTQGKGGGTLANPRTGGLAVGTQPDNLYSVGELERILRPYDPDSFKLPQRLFALLGSQAEIARLAFTTESWDVPVVAGEAARRLYDRTTGWLSGVPSSKLFSTTGPTSPTSTTIPDGVVPPDLASGFRLDITRGCSTDIQRRALFKDLYLTCVALTTTKGSNPTPALAAQYAQWAANVVDYQDADSDMTHYEYDPEPNNGWDVDGDPSTTSEPTRAEVWGAERPEVVITQTLAWDDGAGTNGELYVMLHRPWNSRLEVPSSPPAPPTTAEPSHPDLRGPAPAPDHSIALSKTTPNGEPIWRLRIGTAASDPLVRFDPLPPGSPDLGSTTTPAPAPLSEFRADEWLCVRPAAASPEGVTVPAGVQSFMVSKGPLKAPAGTTAVRLERLAKPSDRYDPVKNPYLVVDAADVTVVLRTPTTPLPHVVHTRDQGWNQHFGSQQFPSSPPLSASWGGSPAWMMWPNRPLISIVELMHVPGFAPNSFSPRVSTATARPSEGLLANYVTPNSPSPPTRLTYLPDSLLMEALRVPSRFAGTRLTIPDTAPNAAFLRNLENIGLYSPIVKVNQLDLGREPGRVNLNTIASDAVWDSVVRGPLSASTTIPSRAAANLAGTQSTPGSGPVTPAKPAETLLNLLSAKSGATSQLPLFDDPADISDVASNPLHAMYSATRLANAATNRSHVFAIWITVRTFEKTGTLADQDTVSYHRMFLIYDRSKPVAYEAGKTHNVRDGILLQRVLQ